MLGENRQSEPTPPLPGAPVGREPFAISPIFFLHQKTRVCHSLHDLILAILAEHRLVMDRGTDTRRWQVTC